MSQMYLTVCIKSSQVALTLVFTIPMWHLGNAIFTMNLQQFGYCTKHGKLTDAPSLCVTLRCVLHVSHTGGTMVTGPIRQDITYGVT